jgi:hypothetical protein
MQVNGQLHTPRKEPLRPNWIGGRAGPRLSEDVVVKRKVLPLLRIKPQSSILIDIFREVLYKDVNITNYLVTT